MNTLNRINKRFSTQTKTVDRMIEETGQAKIANRSQEPLRMSEQRLYLEDFVNFRYNQNSAGHSNDTASKDRSEPLEADLRLFFRSPEW